MTMTRAGFMGLMALALSGCVAAAPAHVWTYPISPMEEDGVKSVVSTALADPRSAIFTPMIGVQGESGVVTACGNVRSKALNGAYTGWRPYRVAIERDAMRLASLAAPRSFIASEVAAQNCRPVAG